MAKGVPSDTLTVPAVLVSEHLYLQCGVQLSGIPGKACRHSVSQDKKSGKVPRGTELGMHWESLFLVKLKIQY